jgi:hypothetical protein
MASSISCRTRFFGTGFFTTDLLQRQLATFVVEFIDRQELSGL